MENLGRFRSMLCLPNSLRFEFWEDMVSIQYFTSALNAPKSLTVAKNHGGLSKIAQNHSKWGIIAHSRENQIYAILRDFCSFARFCLILRVFGWFCAILYEVMWFCPILRGFVWFCAILQDFLRDFTWFCAMLCNFMWFYMVLPHMCDFSWYCGGAQPPRTPSVLIYYKRFIIIALV